MRQGFSEEPSIEPQVQAIGDDGGGMTRRDESHLTAQQPSITIQEQHNVIIQPRLRPMPFKLQDISQPSLPIPT